MYTPPRSDNKETPSLTNSSGSYIPLAIAKTLDTYDVIKNPTNRGFDRIPGSARSPVLDERQWSSRPRGMWKHLVSSVAADRERVWYTDTGTGEGWLKKSTENERGESGELKWSSGVETLSNPEIAHLLVCGQPSEGLVPPSVERENQAWWLRLVASLTKQRHQELESVRMWAIPPLPLFCAKGSVYVSMDSVFELSPSYSQSQPPIILRLRSSVFSTIGKLSPVGMNVS